MRNNSSFGKLVLLLMVFSLIVAACGSDSTDTTAGSTGTTAAGGGDDAAAACDADPFGCVEVGAGEAITIGTLLVISGPNASLGQDSQNGVVMAADYLDGTFDGTNGELLGHPIAFNHQDDGCSAEGGQAGAQALAADPSTIGVVGTSCSSAALGVADTILSDKGISIISPSNTGPALTTPEEHQPFYLRTAHNDKLQGAAVAKFAYNELGARSAATIHDGSPYADGLQAVFADTFESLGGTITVREAIQVQETDFTSVLTSIGADSPDVLYFPIFAAEGGLITQQARQTDGLADTILIGSDGMLSADYVAAAGDAVEGVYLSGPDLSAFTGDQDFYEGEFKASYLELFGGEPAAAFHAHSYDAANMLFDAIKAVAIDEGGTLYIPRTALKDALFATSGVQGITGTLNCNDLGDCQSTATIAVYQVVGGNYDSTNPVYSEVASLDS
ncbi:MAG: branched-chain amino acid ABC transporter substrate-binding protein [Acidimicrobiia bacterium]|nr:branched-chain amino acid ABC transporter substrate-binding protein [Acidimicrobiia bacterium]